MLAADIHVAVGADDEQPELPAARERALERGAELVHLALASDEHPARQPIERVLLARVRLAGGRGARRRDRRQRLAHAPRALGTLLGRLAEQAEDEHVEGARDVGVVPGQPLAPQAFARSSFSGQGTEEKILMSTRSPPTTPRGAPRRRR